MAKAFSATKPNRAIQFPGDNDRGEHILLSDEPLAPGHGLLSNLLKIMGLDGGKIGALAINGILFIAQMVRQGTHFLSGWVTQSIWDWKMIINFVVQKVIESHKFNESAAIPPETTIMTA